MSDGTTETLARHVSPDGQLVFRIERENGVLSFGFEGLPWYLHPETFEAKGRTPEQIALEVVDDLINDRMVVVIDPSNGELEVSILETIESLLEVWGYETPFEFRLWSGHVIDRAELLEGSVVYKPLGEVTSYVPPISGATD